MPQPFTSPPSRTPGLPFRAPDAIVVCLAALFALALLGYHPYSEDGGIYAAAVKLRLNPALFPAQHAMVVAHTGHGLFVRFVAGCVHALGLPLDWVLLILHAGTVTAILAAGNALARGVFRSRRAVAAAVCMLAAGLGAPVAGTGIYFADPYLTARSFSTALLLYAVAVLLQGRALLSLFLWCAAACFHPLMAVWALPLLAAVLAMQSPAPLLSCAALLSGAAAAGFALLHTVQVRDTGPMRDAALSRSYWFLSQWRPAEWIGVMAPLGLLAGMYFLYPGETPTSSEQPAHPRRQLAAAAACAILLCLLLSRLFVHTHSGNLIVAQLQPMRTLQLVYAVLFLLLGGLVLELPGWAVGGVSAVLLIGGTGAGLLFMQRGLYGSSGHIEWPGQPPVNGYEQAFLWTKHNTPADAMFGMDAAYTVAPSEDAQCFRAIAERDAIPDAAKDGGVASVGPELASFWLAGSSAQIGLNTASDDLRRERLEPFGVSWIVLPAGSSTNFYCPYQNGVAKVCRLSR